MKLILVIATVLFLACNSWAGIDFDGTDDFIDLSTNLSLSDNATWTVSLWINSSSTGVTTMYGDRVSFDPDDRFVLLRLRGDSSGEVDCQMRDANPGTTKTITSTTTSLNNGAWHHIMCAKENDNFELWINGVSEDTDATAITEVTAQTGAFIGQLGGAQQFFVGQITEFAIWNTNLLLADAVLLSSSRVKRLPCQISNANRAVYFSLNDVADGASADGVTFRDPCGSETGTGDDGANNTGLTGKAEEVLSYP